MSARALPRRRKGSRLNEWFLTLTIAFSILSLLTLEPIARNSVKNHNTAIDLPRVDVPTADLPVVQRVDVPRVDVPRVDFVDERNNLNAARNVPTKLTSGIGLVTTDGRWDIKPDVSAKYDVKILGFTDTKYIPIAKVWYERLTRLGYKEHYIAAHEVAAYDHLIRLNYRVIPCYVENPDYKKFVWGFFRQIMAARVELVRDLVKNGTHVMLTDVDNVFSRYVNPVGFVEEGYDVYHAYELGYPTHLKRDHGFVICGGHHFFRSSDATIRYLDMAVNDCGGKCDDQVVFNELLWKLDIEWDGEEPSHPGAKRIVSPAANTMNADLLVESATGRSRITNHTFKIWDRDFAWRLSGGIPELCPSKKNWLGMPSMNGQVTNKIQAKLILFDVWDKYCLQSEAQETAVEIVCNSSTTVGCKSYCVGPKCKACWTEQFGQDDKKITCKIIDVGVTVNHTRIT